MKIVLFAHPAFLNSTSMPLFAASLTQGLRNLGNTVEVWAPRAILYSLPAPRFAKKWLGYADQFLLFPMWVKWKLRRQSPNTLFVFSDQALGPWVPLVGNRPAVIHCHDFIALKSALGEIVTFQTSWTGRIYQQLIRRGFSQGKCFISVSKRTQDDLLRLLPNKDGVKAVVVHNGLNHPFAPMIDDRAAQILGDFGSDLSRGSFLLHVGGNQWYKNRIGVLRIYREYAAIAVAPMPLVMIGAAPTDEMRLFAESLPEGARVEFVVRPSVDVLQAAYSWAAAMIFPSLEEGFGWPIVEAMACGCIVFTTDRAPMTEVGGSVARYFAPMPDEEWEAWAEDCAKDVIALLIAPADEIDDLRSKCIDYAGGFRQERVMPRYESVYREALGVTA